MDTAPVDKVCLREKAIMAKISGQLSKFVGKSMDEDDDDDSEEKRDEMSGNRGDGNMGGNMKLDEMGERKPGDMEREREFREWADDLVEMEDFGKELGRLLLVNIKVS